jgi:hypothetical protein
MIINNIVTPVNTSIYNFKMQNKNNKKIISQPFKNTLSKALQSQRMATVLNRNKGICDV